MTELDDDFFEALEQALEELVGLDLKYIDDPAVLARAEEIFANRCEDVA